MTKTEWEDWRNENYRDFGALKNLANDIGEYEMFNNLISTDEVDDFVRSRLESGGWEGVANCISDIIDHMGDGYYEIDGYENLTTCDSWDSYADELENRMTFDVETCDRCGEEFETVHDFYDWFYDKKEEESEVEEEKKIYTDALYEKGRKFLELSTVWDSYEDYCENCFNALIELVKKWDGTDKNVEVLDNGYKALVGETD